MDPKVETTPISEPASASSLKFRILKRQGWKASFRLEEIFWQILGDAARAKNIKIADYVKDAIDNMGGDARNQSSALRVHAAEFLLARCLALQANGEAGGAINAALASPSPCFVLSSGRKLINHNREFYDFVSAAGAFVSPAGVSSALLTLDAEVPKLIDLLASKPGNALTCGYTLRLDARLLRGKARVVLVVQNEAKMLVGYILDSAPGIRRPPDV